MNLLLSVAIGYVLLIYSAPAQDVTKGFYFWMQKCWNEADFRQFEFVSDSIPRVGYNDNLDIGFGGFSNFQISKQLLTGLKIGLFYQKYSLLNSDSHLQNGKSTTSVLTLEEKLLSVSLSPFIHFTFPKNLSLIAGIEFGYAFPINYTIFEVKRFPDQEIKIDYSPAKAKVPYSLSFDIGFGYRFPFTLFNTIYPEAILSYNFGYLLTKNNFTIDRKSIRLSLHLTFENWKERPKTERENLEPLKKIDSISVISQILEINEKDSIKINFVGINDGQIAPPIIEIEKNYIENYLPLLNYIFFVYGKSEIPKRYHQMDKKQVQYFSPNSLLFSNLLDVYYNVLNIIGYRMRKFPKAKLTIIGCNSNIGIEESNLELSKHRAESIAKYLIKTWDIDSNRLQIQFRNLPTNPSNINTPEGNEENQRVEIFSNDNSVFSPFEIIIQSIKTKPELIRFYIQNNKKPKEPFNIAVKLFNMGRLIYSADSTITDQFDSIDVNLNKIQSEPILNNPIDYSIEIHKRTDTTKSLQTIRGSIPTMMENENTTQTDGSKPKQLNLILFDFNSAKLNSQHLSVLHDFRSRLQNSKNIKIFGYTDKIGEEKYNQRLSYERAKVVAKELGIANVSIFGEGEKVELFDNSLPEGRFYSRIVSIVFDEK